MNDIDYTAVIEIINNFLNNEKVEIFGISYGEEHQLRQAIENLLKERQADKDRIKELESINAMQEYRINEMDIPKSLVKEKIKEVKQLENSSISDIVESEKEFCIDVLQELLEEKQDLQINKEG